MQTLVISVNYYRTNIKQKETTVTSSDQTSSNAFEGIWDRRQKPSAITNTAQKYSSLVPEVGSEHRPKKGWGLLSPILALLGYLVVQAIILMLWLQFYPVEDKLNLMQDLTTSPTFILVNAIAGYMVWVGAMFFTTYTRGKGSFVKEYWFSFKKKDFLWGPLIAIAALALVLGVNFLINLAGLSPEGNSNWIKELEGPGLWLVAVGMVTLLGPFCEELFFRGYVLQSVINGREKALKRAEIIGSNLVIKLTAWSYNARYVLSVIISSLIFGLMHFQTDSVLNAVVTVSITGLLGVVFAIMVLKTKRLGMSIVAHIVYNGCNMLLFFLL